MEWSIQRKLDKEIAKTKKRQKWHKHFAILPITIGNTVHWLETVYRREHSFKGNWQYATLMDILRQEEVQANLNILKGNATGWSGQALNATVATIVPPPPPPPSVPDENP